MSSAHDLVAWFFDRMEPFFREYAPDRLPPLVDEAGRLRALLAQEDQAIVCVLGNSGVGKSTLLNAIVAGAGHILPAGGIGPLTALATTVRYGEKAEFRATYHGPQRVGRILFVLEAAHRRQAAPEPGANAPELTEELRALALEVMPAEEAAEALRETAAATEETPEERERANQYPRMAKVLITGRQDVERSLPYLIDGLRLALGRPLLHGTSLEPADATRIERLQRALTLAAAKEAHRHAEDGDRNAFFEDLREHASGSLSPLISEIDVSWPAEPLQGGLVLVDLPGVGVAGDVYRRVTQEYVRGRARAILIVVDRAGMTDSVGDLLRSSGYWDRTVAAAYDPDSDPCGLLVAVTRVDDVVEEEHAQAKHLAGGPIPSRRDMFLQKVAAMRQHILSQTQQQLSVLADSSTKVTPELAEARRTALQVILKGLQVHPVSAPEHRRFLAKDDDDRPRIVEEVSDSGVEALAASLVAIGADLRQRRQEATESVLQRLDRSCRNELAIAEAQWREYDQRLEGESVQLRQQLEEILRPLREELANRRGSFREFLSVGVPTQISALVAEARLDAERSVARYLRGMRDYHWATLKAAVRRGGTFKGARHVDLPNDIADRFQEPVAGVWGMRLLKDIRARTRAHAEDQERLVKSITEWARAQGTRVNSSLLAKQEERIRDRAAQLREVGKEATDDLRETVKRDLHRRISEPIQRRCEAFVEKGDAVGPGVKQRILDLFEELAEESTKAAEKPARVILQKRYEEVRGQVDESFAEWGDPLEETADLIVSRDVQRKRRADAERRRKFEPALDQVRQLMPAQGGE